MKFIIRQNLLYKMNVSGQAICSKGKECGGQLQEEKRKKDTQQRRDSKPKSSASTRREMSGRKKVNEDGKPSIIIQQHYHAPESLES